jgi:hypothetical protein
MNNISCIYPSPVTHNRSRHLDLYPFPPVAQRISTSTNAPTWHAVEAKLREGTESRVESFGVHVRCRPLSRKELEAGNTKSVVNCDEEGGKVALVGGKAAGNTGSERPSEAFTFDSVFGPAATQSDVYEEIGIALVANAVCGFNVCTFALGQTSSGKSHTMVGSKADPGLIPRVCAGLFHSFDKLCSTEEQIGARKVTSVAIECEYFEIYNEQVRDLLDVSQGVLKVREHKKLGVFVDKLSKVMCASAEQACAVLDRGLLNRTVHATQMNSVSSRAHAIFQMSLTQKHEAGGKEMVSNM